MPFADLWKQQCDNHDVALFLQWACRIADDSGAGRHVFGYDRTHSHNRSSTNDQGFIRRPLPQNGTCSDIGMVRDMYVTIAFYAGRKRHKISQDAVMLNIGANIAMKMSANLDIARKGSEW